MRFISLPWALVLVPLLGIGAAWLVMRAAKLRGQRMQRMAEPSMLERIVGIPTAERLSAIDNDLSIIGIEIRNSLGPFR